MAKKVVKIHDAITIHQETNMTTQFYNNLRAVSKN